MFHLSITRLLSILLGLSVSLFVPHSASATNKPTPNCHPSIDQSATQYIIGYGSLINKKSRFRSLERNIEAYPILLKKFERGWFSPGNSVGFDTTYLGITENKTAKLNAIFFEVTEVDINILDKRERVYCRHQVTPKQFTLLAPAATPYKTKSQFWIYSSLETSKNHSTPTTKLPIVQSYVDIFLTGCLNIGKQFQLPDFAKNCIRTTRYWSTHWVNDRIYPQRPFIYQKNAYEIDRLIKASLPKKFKAIRIE